jgi:hypothetical protein
MARICYESNTVVLKTTHGEWTKAIGEEKGGKRKTAELAP